MYGELLVKPLIDGDQMTLLELHYRAGANAPLHVHTHESLIYVVSGQVKTTVGIKVQLLGPGDACCHPQGFPHTVEAMEDAIVIEIKSPPAELAAFAGT